MSLGTRPMNGSFVFFLMVLLLCGGLVCSFRGAYQSETEEERERMWLEIACMRAPMMERFGIENFDSIDKNKDGVLSGDELKLFANENEHDQEVLGNTRYLMFFSNWIGHEIGKREVDGKQIPLFGISRTNLETMEPRLRERLRLARR